MKQYSIIDVESFSRLSIDQVSTQLNIFACGLIDSLSIHKTFPLLISNKEIAYLTFKIFGANTCLVLGTIYLYHNAILPGLSVLRNYMVDGQNNFVEIPGMQTLFYSFMVVPVYLLCYSCSAG